MISELESPFSDLIYSYMEVTSLEEIDCKKKKSRRLERHTDAKYHPEYFFREIGRRNKKLKIIKEGKWAGYISLSHKDLTPTDWEDIKSKSVTEALYDREK